VTSKKRKKIPEFCREAFNNESQETGWEPEPPWKGKQFSPRDWLEANAEQFIVDISTLPDYMHKESRYVDAGVYFLFNKGKLIYIGSTTNLQLRMSFHAKGLGNASKKEFDECRLLYGIPRFYLEHVEYFYINEHRPPLNYKLSTVDLAFRPFLTVPYEVNNEC
jgi:hypothetical protein